MYKLISNNTFLGYVEKPIFVRKLDNGSLGITSLDKAEAISINGQIYPEFTCVKEDLGTILHQIEEKNNANLDYLSMMAGIELPTAGGTSNEE